MNGIQSKQLNFFKKRIITIKYLAIENYPKTTLMLRQYQNRQRLMFLEVGAQAPSVVFATTVREYLPMHSLQQIIDKRCETLGIPRFTCHAFRHTHASLLLNAGISYKELQ